MIAEYISILILVLCITIANQKLSILYIISFILYYFRFPLLLSAYPSMMAISNAEVLGTN
jgi:hypothetical protein